MARRGEMEWVHTDDLGSSAVIDEAEMIQESVDRR